MLAAGCRTARPTADDARAAAAMPCARGRPAHGPRTCDTDDVRELLLAQPRASALGRRRRALPDLRQLHDGLPDLLLHHRRGRDRPHRRRGRARRGAGIPASPWTSPTSTAAACAQSARSRYRQWMTHKLATWSISSAPRAASAAAAASPGARSASTSPRRSAPSRAAAKEAAMKGLSASSPSTGCSTASARSSSTWRPAARRTCASMPDQYLFHADDPADWIYLIRHGRVALRSPRRAAADAFETLGEGEIVGLTWLLPPYRWGYDARAIELVRAIALDAKCLRDKCEDDHDLGYALLKRFLPVLVRGSRPPVCRCWTSMDLLAWQARNRSSPPTRCCPSSSRAARVRRESADTWTLESRHVDGALCTTRLASSPCCMCSASARPRSASAATRPATDRSSTPSAPSAR